MFQEDRDEAAVKRDRSENAVTIKRSDFHWGHVQKNEEDEEEKEEKEELNKTKKTMITIKSEQIQEDKYKEEQPIMEEVFQVVLEDIDISIKKGELVLIVGSVGSGKSSLLNAMLNNLQAVQKGHSEIPIEIDGTLAYAPQTPWLTNDTIRGNILLGNHFDERRYRDTVHYCELQSDFEILPSGEMTELGQKGANLSGGQKARVGLARAVYSNRDIILMDDVLSALDSHVGKSIFEKCILEYLSRKTRVLVTHAVQYLEKADKIIFLEKSKASFVGTYEEFKNSEHFEHFKLETKAEREEDEKIEEVKERKEIDLTQERFETVKKEKKIEGEIPIESYIKFMKYFRAPGTLVIATFS